MFQRLLWKPFVIRPHRGSILGGEGNLFNSWHSFEFSVTLSNFIKGQTLSIFPENLFLLPPDSFGNFLNICNKKNTFFAASCRRDFLKSIFEGLSRQSAAGESLNLFHELYFFFVFGKIQLILSCRWRRGWTESQVENLKNLAANRQKIFQIITKYFQNNSNYHKIVSKYIEISWSGKHKQTGGKKAKTYFPNITKYFQMET